MLLDVSKRGSERDSGMGSGRGCKMISYYVRETGVLLLEKMARFL